jgi:hypothetical protein
MGDAWLWIERLSWIVAIVGIPSLLLGLLALTRRARIEVGFFPLHRERLFFRSVQRPSKASRVSSSNDPIKVSLVVTNVGRATGRELLLNLTFPTLTVEQLVVPPDAPRVIQHPVRTHPLWAYRIDHIHPDDHHISELLVRAAEKDSNIPIEYEISMADATVTRGSCRLIVT